MKTAVFWTIGILAMFGSTVAVPIRAEGRSPQKLTIVELPVVDDARICSDPSDPSPPQFGSAGVINKRRDVVGAFECFGEPRAALWRDGVMTDLFAGQHFAPSGASDINDRGQVIGFRAFDLEFFEFEAFFWEGGVRTVLSLPELGKPRVDSRASAINERGQVVGFSTLGPFGAPFHAYLFQDGAIMDLGTLPGGRSSWAKDINDRGQIVGVNLAEPVSGQIARRAVLWQDGTIVDLGTLGGDESEAIAINNRGQILGTSTTATGARRAFLWQGGVMTNLGTLGGTEIVPFAINRHGQVVGYSTNAAGDRRAFLWDDGIMRDLGTLGGNVSLAFDINNHGQVIDESTTTAGDVRPFLWQDGVMTDLSPETPFTQVHAVHINDRGEIGGSIDRRPVVWTERPQQW